MTEAVFYVFATVLILSAGMVIGARNPVHSVLFLILAFFNAAGLFLLAGAEFLAMLLVIVYVGAVAVLFLFVVMMLDIKVSAAREGFQRYAPFGAAVGGVLFAELLLAVGQWRVAPAIGAVAHLGQAEGETNTAALGDLIYTHYVLLFQACGLVLLVAMIGAIVLTLRERPTARRQDIARQHARMPEDTLELRSLPLGQSVSQLGGFMRPRVSYTEIAADGSFDPNAPVLTDDSKGK